MNSVNEKTAGTLSPVFIHSLFRAGSTYLFNQFRHSPNGYWCYQEPLHEYPYFCRNDREKILDIRNTASLSLRHPLLDAPYFQELYQVSEICLPKLKSSYIYTAYFSKNAEEAGTDYFRALINAAQGRTVIQECRTSSRISVLRENLGGTHLYLWRNPWDQWWSLNINDYFPAILQLIAAAPISPEVIRRLKDEISINACPTQEINEQIEWYRSRPLSSEESYLTFYILWCLSLIEALSHANLLLNIDKLSESPEYAAKLAASMHELGVDGVKFDNCRIPQTQYTTEDASFFRSTEDKAHGLLLLSGIPQSTLDDLTQLRLTFAPRAPVESETPSLDRADVLRDASRARSLARSTNDNLAKACAHHWKELAKRESNWSEQLDRANQTAQQIQSRADQRIEELQRQLEELEGKAHLWWLRSNELDNVYASRAWRMTAPARCIAAATKSLILTGRVPTAAHKPLRVLITQSLKLYTRIPFVQRQVKKLMDRNPYLRNRILGYATNQGIVNGQFTIPKKTAPAHELAMLSPRGREIFDEILNALSKRNIGKEIK